jgi:DNA-binding GntR family transcriptional regulator
MEKSVGEEKVKTSTVGDRVVSTEEETLNLQRKKLLSVEIQKEFDVFRKEWEERVFVKLYVAARTSGLLAAISDRDWKTLCAIATFMDKNGNCYPSQAQIAKALGVSRATANERIASLINFRFKGQPVVLKTHLRDEKGKFSCCRYTILPLSNLYIFDRDSKSTVSGKSDTVFPESGYPNTNYNQVKQEPGLEQEKQQLNVVVESPQEKKIGKKLKINELSKTTRKRRKRELKTIIQKYSHEILNEALKRTVKAEKEGEIKHDIIRFFGGVCENVKREFEEAERKKKEKEERVRKNRLSVAASTRECLLEAGFSPNEIRKELLRQFDEEVVNQVMKKIEGGEDGIQRESEGDSQSQEG